MKCQPCKRVHASKVHASWHEYAHMPKECDKTYQNYACKICVPLHLPPLEPKPSSAQALYEGEMQHPKDVHAYAEKPKVCTVRKILQGIPLHFTYEVQAKHLQRATTCSSIHVNDASSVCLGKRRCHVQKNHGYLTRPFTDKVTCTKQSTKLAFQLPTHLAK